MQEKDRLAAKSSTGDANAELTISLHARLLYEEPVCRDRLGGKSLSSPDSTREWKRKIPTFITDNRSVQYKNVDRPPSQWAKRCTGCSLYGSAVHDCREAGVSLCVLLTSGPVRPAGSECNLQASLPPALRTSLLLRVKPSCPCRQMLTRAGLSSTN